MARKGDTRNAHEILVLKSVGKLSVELRRRRWDDKIKTDLRKLCYEGKRWTELALKLAALNLRIPLRECWLLLKLQCYARGVIRDGLQKLSA